MRAVFDTNVLVSAFNFPGGTPEDAYRLILDGDARLITSRPLLVELGGVLIQKFGWELDRTEMAVDQLVRIAEVVSPRESVSTITDDDADNRVLEAALEGECDVVVSGDRHLLRLRIWRGIRILDPKALMTEFE